MRLTAWNLCGGIERKATALRALRPDIAVLSEVGENVLGVLGSEASGAWIGLSGGRGLAVVGFGGWRVRKADGITVADRLFLPVVAENGTAALTIVGACVKEAGGYAAPVRRAIETLAPLLASGRAILAGDFNLTVRLDPRRSAGAKAQPVMDRLASLGMRSAWHSHTGEAFGDETAPTYCHRWRNEPANRFHIDYAFVSPDLRVEAVAIGEPQDYLAARLSDHMPLSVDLAL